MCFGSCGDGDDERPPVPGNKPYQQPPSASAPASAYPYGPNPSMQPPIPMDTKPAADSEIVKVTQTAIDVWLASKQDNGEVAGVTWWQTANGYTAIALHDRYTHSARNAVTLRTQLSHCSSHCSNLINEFNDDTLWFGHALLDLYVSVHRSDPWLLQTAHSIFQHISRYQLPHGKFLIENGAADMGGAVLWTSRDGEDNANTITTSLYAEFAARLALETPATGQDPERRAAWRFLDAAERAVGWILREVYRRDDEIILDGISMNKNDRCGWTFTYTTGQTIAACVVLARALREVRSYGKEGQAAEYMSTACVLTHASVQRPIWVNEEGVLIERRKREANPWENNDAWGFKSVLVRSLAKLYVALKTEGWARQGGQFAETEGVAKHFIETQFRALRERDCSDDGRGHQYGAWWPGPFEAATSHSQLSVLDVMAAIHAVRD